mmetsp:Transcript_3585/g.4969  ORF Transcript_3585/g.4969 Transcript_3585/m.4969 type:complete len:248 (+) Transcript_3585:1002-1745(+)
MSFPTNSSFSVTVGFKFASFFPFSRGDEPLAGAVCAVWFFLFLLFDLEVEDTVLFVPVPEADGVGGLEPIPTTSPFVFVTLPDPAPAPAPPTAFFHKAMALSACCFASASTSSSFRILRRVLALISLRRRLRYLIIRLVSFLASFSPARRRSLHIVAPRRTVARNRSAAADVMAATVSSRYPAPCLFSIRRVRESGTVGPGSCFGVFFFFFFLGEEERVVLGLEMELEAVVLLGLWLGLFTLSIFML